MLKAIDEASSIEEYRSLIERAGVTWAIEGSAAKSRLCNLTKDERGKSLYRIKEVLKAGIPWMQTITLTADVDSDEKLSASKEIMKAMFEDANRKRQGDFPAKYGYVPNNWPLSSYMDAHSLLTCPNVYSGNLEDPDEITREFL